MNSHTRLGLAVLIVIVLVTAVTVGLTAGCNKPAATTAATSAPAVAGVVYSCPMHPDVQSDKPGTCPKCHMDLVKKG